MDLFKEIEEVYIDTNGIKLHTIIIGSGEPLILLHGFPEFWYCWKSVIPGLKEMFQLIIPDLRGYNLSDKPKDIEKYKMEYLVGDIKGLIEELNLKQVFLAGHDWGGVVAWAFAEKHPELLKKLIILNAPHGKIFQKTLKTNKEQQEASSYIFEFLKPGAEKKLYEDNYRRLKKAVFEDMVNKSNFTEFDREKYIEAWSQPGALLGGVNYYRAITSFDELTGVIEVPTLVIWGMKDVALLPQQLEGLSDYVKNLKIVRSDNSSHWITNDDPDLIVSSIKEFVAE
ncbi:MAG: alpha/beta fold hydrolase [Candidatus Hodarchaeota archaeon]